MTAIGKKKQKNKNLKNQTYSNNLVYPLAQQVWVQGHNRFDCQIHK